MNSGQQTLEEETPEEARVGQVNETFLPLLFQGNAAHSTGTCLLHASQS